MSIFSAINVSYVKNRSAATNTGAAEREAKDETSETEPPNNQCLLWPEHVNMVFKILHFGIKGNCLRCGMRSRMPVRMVSTMANCESRPKVKSMAKKRIAQSVGKGNLVTRSG